MMKKLLTEHGHVLINIELVTVAFVRDVDGVYVPGFILACGNDYTYAGDHKTKKGYDAWGRVEKFLDVTNQDSALSE